MKDTQGPEESQGWERKGNGLLPRMLWAYEAGQQFHLSATQSAVLLNLAFHMHKDRAEWAMAQDSIAKETRLSAKTVSRAFDVLIRRELVILLRSGKGSLSQATNVYSLAGFKTKWQLIDADTPEKVGTESPKTEEAIGHCVQSWDRESENGTQSPMSWDTVSENGTQSPNNPPVTLPSTYPSLLPFPEEDDEKKENDGEREKNGGPTLAYSKDGQPANCGPCHRRFDRDVRMKLVRGQAVCPNCGIPDQSKSKSR